MASINEQVAAVLREYAELLALTGPALHAGAAKTG